MTKTKLYLHNTRDRGLAVFNGSLSTVKAKEVGKWIEDQSVESEIYALKGGCGDAILLRLYQRGHPVLWVGGF